MGSLRLLDGYYSDRFMQAAILYRIYPAKQFDVFNKKFTEEKRKRFSHIAMPNKFAGEALRRCHAFYNMVGRTYF
jgi:hypothetical protein